MTKLLILMLVLGMASTASAVVVPSPQTYYFAMDISGPGTDFVTGDTITIDIYAGDTVPVTAMFDTVLNISAAAGIGSITQGSPASWTTYNATTSADGMGGFNVNVNGNQVTAGIPVDALVYSVSFTAGAAGEVIIDATVGNWSGNTAVVGPVDGLYDGVTPAYEAYGLPYKSITIVPEPMTIALLGLGGLVLLRRRK